MDRALQTFERVFGPEFGHGKGFDLARLKCAIAQLCRHTSVPPVIHVAGTNGKGSTIAYMRAIVDAAGMKAHAFTKPHLLRLTERFTVAGEEVDEDTLIDAAERVAAIEPALSQFDAQVAAALLLFSETPADVALIEAGMGGRYDSTNVFDWPSLSVITPIALDHQDALGASIEEIARHKAGILKRHVHAITAKMDEAVFRAIEDGAPKPHLAPILRGGDDWDAHESAGRLIVKTEWSELDLPLPPLAGAHQIDNAGLAIAALQYWRNFDDDEFARGVANARLPARLQPLTGGAMSAAIRAGGGEVWVDAAHNAHAAQALARWLADMNNRRPAPAVAIIGMRARKEADAFIGALAGVVNRVIGVPLGDAHLAPAAIAAICDRFGIRASATPSLNAAISEAAKFPAPRVLICGSFLLAGEALALEGA